MTASAVSELVTNVMGNNELSPESNLDDSTSLAAMTNPERPILADGQPMFFIGLCKIIQKHKKKIFVVFHPKPASANHLGLVILPPFAQAERLPLQPVTRTVHLALAKHWSRRVNPSHSYLSAWMFLMERVPHVDSIGLSIFVTVPRAPSPPPNISSAYMFYH